MCQARVAAWAAGKNSPRKTHQHPPIGRNPPRRSGFGRNLVVRCTYSARNWSVNLRRGPRCHGFRRTSVFPACTRHTRRARLDRYHPERARQMCRALERQPPRGLRSCLLEGLHGALSTGSYITQRRRHPWCRRRRRRGSLPGAHHLAVRNPNRSDGHSSLCIGHKVLPLAF